MSEERERQVSKLYTWDLTDGYDTQNQKEIFLRKLRLSPFYRADLLYCGFNARDIGKKTGSTKGKDIVFASDESMFDRDMDNPFDFALQYSQPAIAVYDKEKLELADEEHEDSGYKIKEPSALITVIRLKVE